MEFITNFVNIIIRQKDDENLDHLKLKHRYKLFEKNVLNKLALHNSRNILNHKLKILYCRMFSIF